jgi:hypothetical protein
MRATAADKESLWWIDQDDLQTITRVKTRYLIGQEIMESSRRYLLQAEIEYWHEMLRLNKSRVSKNREEDMRVCLKKAIRAMNSNTSGDFQAAA